MAGSDSAATVEPRRQFVVYEETSEEREVVGYCRICRATPDEDVMLVSPQGIAHHAAMDTTDCGHNTRYTLAVIDNTIIDLSVEAKAARDMAQEATTRAERLDSFKARLMEARDALRPLLDPSAPREYPYDKR